MDPALRLQPGQQELTPAQEAEARRFAAERMQAQLSTEPVDEQESETLLRRAYRALGRLSSPRISWVERPPHLQKLIPPGAGWRTVFMFKMEETAGASVWKSLGRGALPTGFRPIGQNPLWRTLYSLFRQRSPGGQPVRHSWNWHRRWRRAGRMAHSRKE